MGIASHFDDHGNLVLSPSTSLERMACRAFITSMHKRQRPQILVEGDVAASGGVPEVPGQQRLAGLGAMQMISDDPQPGVNRTPMATDRPKG